MKTKLTIHKIAQVDRVATLIGLTHPSIQRGCARILKHHGYLSAWRFLVDNNAHQS